MEAARVEIKVTIGQMHSRAELTLSPEQIRMIVNKAIAGESLTLAAWIAAEVQSIISCLEAL